MVYDLFTLAFRRVFLTKLLLLAKITRKVYSLCNLYWPTEFDVWLFCPRKLLFWHIGTTIVKLEEKQCLDIAHLHCIALGHYRLLSIAMQWWQCWHYHSHSHCWPWRHRITTLPNTMNAVLLTVTTRSILDLQCAAAMWEDDKSPLPLMQHRQRAQKEI